MVYYWRSSIDAPSLLYLSSSCWRAIRRLLLGLLLSSSDVSFVVFPSASPETRQGKARGGTDAALSPSSRAISSTTVSNGQTVKCKSAFPFLPLLLHSVAAIVPNLLFLSSERRNISTILGTDTCNDNLDNSVILLFFFVYLYILFFKE